MDHCHCFRNQITDHVCWCLRAGSNLGRTILGLSFSSKRMLPKNTNWASVRYKSSCLFVCLFIYLFIYLFFFFCIAVWNKTLLLRIQEQRTAFVLSNMLPLSGCPGLRRIVKCFHHRSEVFPSTPDPSRPPLQIWILHHPVEDNKWQTSLQRWWISRDSPRHPQLLWLPAWSIVPFY